MKLLIKYISLLLFSGLILPFCKIKTVQNTIIAPCKKVAQLTKPQHPTGIADGLAICHDIAVKLFPLLKN